MSSSLRNPANALHGPQPDQSFTPTRPGPRSPPPLTSWIEYRAESQPHCWWAFWADGTLAEMCTSSAAAQAAIATSHVKGAQANG